MAPEPDANDPDEAARQAAMAEERAAQAEERARQAEERAEQAEERAEQAEERAEQAEERVQEKAGPDPTADYASPDMSHDAGPPSPDMAQAIDSDWRNDPPGEGPE